MKIREIDAARIRETVRDLCMTATTELGEDVVGAVKTARAEEPSGLGRDILGQILKNADIARQECISLCQDAGMAVVFVALGQDVHITGGNLEMAAETAKRSLLRPVGQANPRPDVAEIEADLLARINRLGIGPQGLGGRTTALAVHVEIYPTHIGSLPVAVNLQCHSHRHRSAEL